MSRPDHHLDLRLQHLPHPAGAQHGGPLQAQGGGDRSLHGQQPDDRPGARLHPDAWRHPDQGPGHQQGARRAARHPLQRQPGGAALRANPHRRPGASAGKAEVRRHRHPLGDADPRQRGAGLAHHQQLLQAWGACLLLRTQPGPRFGARQPRGAEADVEPGAAQILHAGARRVPPPRAAFGDRPGGRHRQGPGDRDRRREYGRAERQPAALRQQGAGRLRLRRRAGRGRCRLGRLTRPARALPGRHLHRDRDGRQGHRTGGLRSRSHLAGLCPSADLGRAARVGPPAGARHHQQAGARQPGMAGHQELDSRLVEQVPL